MSVNKFIGIGRLGQDPDLKYAPSGTAVCNFSIAITEKYKGEEKTEWVRVVTFGKLAEICGQYLKKGKQVYIEGKMTTRDWEDKDGNRRYTTEIIANEMRMLGDGRGNQDNQSQSNSSPDGGTYF